MALHQLTEAELDAVTGGSRVRQSNASLQAAINVAKYSTLNTSATANASYGGSASAVASGGQYIEQNSSQSNSYS